MSRHINNVPDRATVARLRAAYPAGCRVELLSMDDPYTNLKPGDTGEVSRIDDIGTIFVDWDNGSSLGVADGVDFVRKI